MTLKMAAARAAALALLVLPVFGASASADPIPLLAYERVLSDARAEVDAARVAQGEGRRLALRRASALLDSSREVRVVGAVYRASPHATIRALLEKDDDTSLATASAMLEETLNAVRRAESPGADDPERSRALLDTILASPDFRRPPDWRDALLSLVAALVALLLPDARWPSFTLTQVTVAFGSIAIILLALVARFALGGLRAKVAREVLLSRDVAPRGPTAADHLRAAEEARRAGRLRDALRELFLGALLALEQRGALRLDPALTDHELLARAAASPRALDLEALVALYERAWYGLREPTDVDVDRASALAERIAA